MWQRSLGTREKKSSRRKKRAFRVISLNNSAVRQEITVWLEGALLRIEGHYGPSRPVTLKTKPTAKWWTVIELHYKCQGLLNDEIITLYILRLFWKSDSQYYRLWSHQNVCRAQKCHILLRNCIPGQFSFYASCAALHRNIVHFWLCCRWSEFP